MASDAELADLKIERIFATIILGVVVGVFINIAIGVLLTPSANYTNNGVCDIDGSQPAYYLSTWYNHPTNELCLFHSITWAMIHLTDYQRIPSQIFIIAMIPLIICLIIGGLIVYTAFGFWYGLRAMTPPIERHNQKLADVTPQILNLQSTPVDKLDTKNYSEQTNTSTVGVKKDYSLDQKGIETKKYYCSKCNRTHILNVVSDGTKYEYQYCPCCLCACDEVVE